MFFAVSIIFFCALAIAGFAVVQAFKDRDETELSRRRRLGAQTGLPYREAEVEKGHRSSPVKDLRLSSIEALNNFLARRSLVSNLARMMRQAGMNRRVGEVVLYLPLCGMLGGMIGLGIVGNPAVAIALSIAGFYLPILLISRMRARRLHLFSEQLPDALDLLRSALQAGHSFIVALKVVAEEFPDPIAAEFDTVAEEIKLGLPIREALLGLQDRVDEPNLPMLIIGVLVVQESGGNLSEVLNNVGHTVRERFKLLRDVEVMTAQGRLSGMMLSALPVIVGGLMMVVAPDYMGVMLTEATGHYMLGYAALSILIGHLTIQKMVQIRV